MPAHTPCLAALVALVLSTITGMPRVLGCVREEVDQRTVYERRLVSEEVVAVACGDRRPLRRVVRIRHGRPQAVAMPVPHWWPQPLLLRGGSAPRAPCA
jgi:hypothetical protein